MGKRNYVRPLAAAELFTPNEFVASCTDSASMSPDGEYIYGWVVHCENLTDRNPTIKGCDDQTFQKQDGGTVRGIFIRANNQEVGQDFGPTTVASGYTVSDPEHYGNFYWWIVKDPGGTEHAIKVGGSISDISYPYSYKYLVNHS